MIRRFILICVFAALPAFAQGTTEESEVAQIAEAYIEAFEAVDLEALSELVSEDFVFSDPTSENAQGQLTFHFEGRQAFIEGFERLKANGLRRLSYEHAPLHYDSTGYAVFFGVINVYRDRGEKMRLETELTTIIQVRDGQVTRHLDYADYGGTRRYRGWD